MQIAGKRSRKKDCTKLGNVKVLIELLQKFAGFLGAEPLSRLSQQAKHPYTPIAQEGEWLSLIKVSAVWEPSPGVPGRGLRIKKLGIGRSYRLNGTMTSIVPYRSQR